VTPRRSLAPWRALAVTVALVAALASPRASAAPPCVYGDIVAPGDPHTDHATMLLDTTYRLPAEAEPTDLVSVREAGFDADHRVRAVVVDDLRALRAAAAEAGHRLAVQSAFRSFAYQRQVHDGWVRALGRDRARRVSARPGHSEHQLGTAIDLRSASGPPAWEVADWAATAEGSWVVANAHRYGFVLSYPRGEEERTCYDDEPWHLRWVGRELAALVTASGLPLRAWLYLHHPPTGAP
jgi:zinc D-Ala-D-Ala carboxypeptidase